ncbi:MAG TPA: AAA family ATPase [Turneriella sp.]|nr:AAA family ATPase [Turneriella sp.]
MFLDEAKAHVTSGDSSVILFSGNVRDVYASHDGKSTNIFYTLAEILRHEVLGDFNTVAEYDPQGGIQFSDATQREVYFRSLSGYDAYHKTTYAQNPPKDPGPAFSILDNLARLALLDNKSFAVVIHYLDHIIPTGMTNNSELRYLIIALDKWAQNPAFRKGKIRFLLIAPELARLDAFIGKNAFIERVIIPRPALDERKNTLKNANLKGEAASEEGLTKLAELTAGLTNRQILTVVAKGKTDELELRAIKKELISAECRGLLEIVEPKYALDAVAGHDKVKEILSLTAKAIQQGKTSHLPMGFLISGPVGTGKTFITECFAHDAALPVVKFLNFRSQWQGETEANLEKIFTILKSIYPVAVIIDEADAFLGNRDAQGDSGVSMRVFASLAALMSDTKYRGKIIWFLMTSRPDLLPIDMKRQGRAEEHLALFHPQSKSELEALYQVVCKKLKIQPPMAEISPILDKARAYSGADIEAMLTRSALAAEVKYESALTETILRETIGNFRSPEYPLAIELQTLVAVRECTHQDMIPEKWRTMKAADIEARINELLFMLRQR